MARRISALMFLLLILETEPKWKPSIMAVPDIVNRSLIVTVKPVRPPIAYLKVCISKTSSIPCVGKVFLMESPNETLRYRVEGLPTNRSYYIYVRPYDLKGREVDIWLHKEKSIFLEPWPEAPTSTTTSTTPRPTEPSTQPEKPEIEETVGLEVVVVLVVLVVLLVTGLFSYCLYRKGYLKKIWFLRWCLPQTAFHGPPIKVLQLYVNESPTFQRLVKKHMEYLNEFIHLDSMDCDDMRHQHNMDMWLRQDSTILVYLSPQLMKGLLHPQDRDTSEGFTQQNPLLSKKVNYIHTLASAMAAHKGRRCRRSPIIFIVPGCWSADLGSQLGQIFKNLPRFSLTSAPEPLLSRLSGHYHCRLTTCWSHSEQIQELRTTIGTLLQTIQSSQSKHHVGVHMNGYMKPGEDCDFDAALESNGYSCMGTPHGRQGHTHRNDSGFSSSAPNHHRGGSNSSSEPVDHHVENGEEEGGTERDPMIQTGGDNLVVSDFLPPDSVADSVAGEDVESVGMQEDFRRVNYHGEWSS